MKTYLQQVNLRRLFLAVIAFCGLALMALSALVQNWLNKPLAIAEHFEYILEPGGSVARAAYDLHKLNVLDQPRWLSLYARFADKAAVKAGEYLIPPGTTPLQLLELLERGDVIHYRATFIEGWTFQQALDYLHQQPKIKALLKGLSLEQQLAQLDVQISHPEGWFFPDTYEYTARTSDIALLKQAHLRMQTILEEEWQGRAKGLPYKSSYEALTMASIVERETGQASEREQIAGVFVRRLQKKMRLQTDPTVIYGLGADFDGNLRRKHLSQPTPYNTYVIKGLPPTPIALPGREAIAAALHPADGSALYFVAKGDGSHYFSSTLEEHNKAVRRYQVYSRSSSYRSSPKATSQ